MVKKAPVPDAWEDDDWETAADRPDGGPPLQPEPQAPLSKAERLAQHAELNRKLWEAADSPTPLAFFESQPSVPLATGFKPQVKVLSRKPTPGTIARHDPVTGLLSDLSLAAAADDDDDDNGAEKKPRLTPEEIRAKQQRELEEKQRRYEEARAKIFGEFNPPSGASSPGTTTPPRGGGGGGGSSENERGGGRGRNRGYRTRGGGHRGNNSTRQEDHRRPGSGKADVARPESGRELYDPGYAPRGGFATQRRGADPGPPHSGRSTPRDDDHQPRPALRAPRGPDGSGKRGFGFARRGSTKEG